MKPILFIINDRCSLKPGGTNLQMIQASIDLGYPVMLSDVVHLHASGSSQIFCDALQLPRNCQIESASALQNMLANAPAELVCLNNVEAVFIRTTPGKDIGRAWAHRFALEVLRLASENGVRVVNSPAGLQKASSKFYTVCLPADIVPKTMVCHSLQSVMRFVDQLNGPLVIKPLLGSQGRDVFFFENASATNMRQVVDILGRTGYLVVQEYLPEARDGDIRVLTLGDTLVKESQPVGIQRTPASGEMRSNIALGGTAKIVMLNHRQSVVCQRIAKQLASEGILFAGLDLIGEKVVEVNVFSPSGLQEYALHFEPDVSGELVRFLLESPVVAMSP